EQVSDFTTFAEDLQAYSWRLTNKEQHFMEAVIHLQGELASDAPFIEAVENAHSCHHEMVSTIFDQTMNLKENMRVHEELLNLAFAEEEAVSHRIKVLEDELNILH
ncbi:hypothetical protein A2U01_0066744, partial [Trifolium medium]|nr:hypothetical protein [Trifolium medium]